MIQFLATTRIGCRRSFPRRSQHRITALAVWASAALVAQLIYTPTLDAESDDRPNIVLVMADDQGWAQTGYYSHPVLKTPNLDAMAEEGLRLDRFYAGAPVCSPTRASVLTGRANDRTGVESHGYGLRRQELTIARLLGQAGYATGHFGKWHLNAIRGPGVPILASDDHNPGEFGFGEWLSVTNFFDRDPLLSRGGKFEDFQGDSSEIVVAQASEFISQQHRAGVPSLTVIWFGTPHNPFKASVEDRAPFEDLDEDSKHHYGELVAMDRSIGTLQSKLRGLGIRDSTLVWFCSDNGGLPKIKPSTVGPLRGNKGTIYEGGLRVPGIIQWPAVIADPRVSEYPASVLDILPTLLDVVDVPYPLERPLDGISLKPLFTADLQTRSKPIPFRHIGRAAWVDNDYKLLTNRLKDAAFELYDLRSDPGEARDVSGEHPEIAERMARQLLQWSQSVDASFAGKDYPEGQVNSNEPSPRFWTEMPEYRPYFDEWRQRWEYKSRLANQKKPKG
jgi:arylsulfatase A-like enzyme